MPDTDWSEQVRAFAAERRLRPTCIDRWLALSATDGSALLTLASELRLGENQLRDLWEWAEEIALRDASTLAAVLESEPLRSVRGSRLGRADALKAFKAALRRLRFPEMAAQERRIAALVDRLGLPAGVRVQWPEFLEGDSLRVVIDARGAGALRAAAYALGEAAQRAECAEIFSLLDGAKG